jgi:uncharacterized RDD family membrane protein YckC
MLYLRRSLAASVDILVGFVPLLLALPLLVPLALSGESVDQLVWRGVAITLLPVCLLWFSLMQIIQISRNRQTLGRKLARIQIVHQKPQQRSLTITEALLRVMLSAGLLLAIVLVGLLPLILLLPLSALLDPDGKAVYDRLLGTQAVSSDFEEQKEAAL